MCSKQIQIHNDKSKSYVGNKYYMQFVTPDSMEQTPYKLS